MAYCQGCADLLRERDAALRRADAAEARLGEAERLPCALAGRLERIRDGWHDEADEVADLEAARAFLAAAPAAPPEPPGARWVPVAEALPPLDLPVLLWGDKLTVDLDHPLAGRLCGCHERWLIEEDYNAVYSDDTDPDADQEEECVTRMLGTVTHWLDWRPGPAAPRPEPETGGEG